MKICYIISTYNKYLDDKIIFQMNSFLKHINNNDIYYLIQTKNEDVKYININNSDNNIYKYFNLFRDVKIENKYDWYIFINDDTFIFHNRLIKLLKNYNCNENYYIGKLLDEYEQDYCIYMSINAGFIISKNLYNLIINLINDDIEKAILHWTSDICIGLYINEISKNNSINSIYNNNFNDLIPNNIELLDNSISCGKIIEFNQWNFLNTISEKEMTVCVVLSDKYYKNKVMTTINDLRTVGNWKGTIIHINIGYNLDIEFKYLNNVKEIDFPLIDKTNLLEKIGKDGFKNSDKREINKLTQWEKFHVFDDYFKKWSRVIYFDAGLRIFDDIKCLLNLDYKNKIVAPDDCYNSSNIFKQQIVFDNQEYINIFQNDYSNYNKIYNSNYFLNCIWIYDTKILDICNKNELIDCMNKYPICRTNEMTIMNILFHFKYNLWNPFPIKTLTSNNQIKYLFEWCEIKNSGTTVNDYCFIKYPMNNIYKII